MSEVKSGNRLNDEIEITPKMIGIGLSVLRESYYGSDLSEVAEWVYLRMEIERRDYLQRLSLASATSFSQ